MWSSSVRKTGKMRCLRELITNFSSFCGFLLQHFKKKLNFPSWGFSLTTKITRYARYGKKAEYHDTKLTSLVGWHRQHHDYDLQCRQKDFHLFSKMCESKARQLYDPSSLYFILMILRHICPSFSSEFSRWKFNQNISLVFIEKARVHQLWKEIKAGKKSFQLI